MASVTSPVLVNSANAQRVKRTVVYENNNNVKSSRRTSEKKSTVKVVNTRQKTLPARKTIVSSRPANTVLVRKNGRSFHYKNGVFYKSVGSRYVVTSPIVGLRVNLLPSSARILNINNACYYYYHGTFYAPVRNGRGGRSFEVVRAPAGAVVDTLPGGYIVKKVRGKKHYILDGVHYQRVERGRVNGGIGFRVVIA